MVFRFLALVGLCLATVAQAASFEQNWPQWRGPLQNGVAPQGDPPIKWSETENVKWKVRLPGRGTSTPIIWGDLLLIATAIPTGKKVEAPQASAQPPQQILAQQTPPADAPPGERRRRRPGGLGSSEKPTEVHHFMLLGIDRKTGKTLWERVLREEVPHESHHQDHGYASHSPVTDGQGIYVYWGSRGLHALDMKGNVKWQKDLGKQQTRNSFGEGASPALHDNTLVVSWDHEGDDFVAAFDKTTGKEIWRKTRQEKSNWSTPLIVTHNGKTQVIINATAKIRSYDITNGEVLWEASGMTDNVIPTPVADSEKVYVMSGFRGNNLLAIKLGSKGNLDGTDAIAWSHKKSTPYVPSPLLYGDKLYFFANNNGILSCFNTKTGEPLIDAERITELAGVYASPVGASGKVFLLGRTGGGMVLKNTGKMDVLAKNQLDEKFDASPAIVGKEMFLRGHQFLYCISETK